MSLSRFINLSLSGFIALSFSKIYLDNFPLFQYLGDVRHITLAYNFLACIPSVSPTARASLTCLVLRGNNLDNIKGRFVAMACCGPYGCYKLCQCRQVTGCTVNLQSLSSWETRFGHHSVKCIFICWSFKKKMPSLHYSMVSAVANRNL